MGTDFAALQAMLTSLLPSRLTRRAPFMLPLLGLTAIAACSSRNQNLPDADGRASIQMGVYGITTAQDDVGQDLPVLPLPQFSILVYDHVPPVTSNDDGSPVDPPLLQTSSDRTGFYEIEMNAGRYVFCSWFFRCVWLNVPGDQRLRLDYSFGVGPGWSRGDPVQR